ncbi:hypothetical protein ACIBP6_05360 [Nonomuraea terrae]|uniref:hypothetical protein n=1 Tax=Nonomuraea terrae TaxID=2530383 RepID=UPI003790692D
MKKMITMLAAAGALTLGAAPAQAAPKDPVRALESMLKPGRGVHVTDTVTGSDGTSTREAGSGKGVYQFGEKGLSGFDLTMEDDYGTQRVIATGKTVYRTGGLLKNVLSEDKPWLKGKGGGYPGGNAQIINPAEPRTVATLLKKGTSSKGSVTGTITVKDLKKVSSWASGLNGEQDDVKISYALTLGSSGLVSRVRSTWELTELGESSIVTIDSRYTKWGSKVTIKAPDPKKITTELFG